MSSARKYCFTVFNLEQESAVHGLCKRADYGIMGRETCPTTGRKHLQCYVYYKNKISFKELTNTLPGVHVEFARGSSADNRNYCSKDGDFVEYGTCPQQGFRSDISAFRDAIYSGASEEKLIDEYPDMMAKYDRFYQRCRNILLKKEAKKMIQPEVVVLVGEPGIGKTRHIYDTEDIDNIYKVEVGDGSANSIFWDNYNGEQVILIDDFHNNFKLDYMLRLLDRYPMKLNIKGGHTWKCATRIYITSNIHPDNWYNNCPQIHRKALFRRITKILQL